MSIDQPSATIHNFGEIASVQHVFADAKKLRKARQPEYVLVVEDDTLTSRVVSNAFKDRYVLVNARDAKEAVAQYLTCAPDIVFLDIGLPDASGFDVLRQIMACDKDAYVVMFSSNNSAENIARALNEGAAGFVAKPFKKEYLRDYITASSIHHHKSEGYAC